MSAAIDKTEPASTGIGRNAADFLRIGGVSKAFAGTPVLRNVSLQVHQGEFVCILGPSGCGKTTLLRIIAGLETADAGRVFIGGRDVTRTPTAGRGIGIVFQSYALFPNLTALQNVTFGMRRMGMGKRAILDRAGELLDTVGLGDSGRKYPAQLSGGQQQRVALARALAPSPSILLLDEPLSALDAKVRQSLRKEIRRLQQKTGITAVMVTHDQEEALTMSDRVVVMSKGRLAQFASPEEIYRLPSTPFVADFIGSMNFLHGWLPKGHTVTRGGVTMRLPRPAPEDVTHAILAIRPEDVQVGRDTFPEENSLIARITEMEFRGTGYTITFAAPTAGGGGDLVFDALVPPLRVSGMRFRIGETVKVKFPRERLVCFRDEGLQADGSRT